ncbi:MAG: tetratricopeptide repeat protein [bacterium]
MQKNIFIDCKMKIIMLLCMVNIVLFWGCAIRSEYSIGQKAIDEGNYDGAISIFQYALRKSPDDPKILTELGYAYYKKFDFYKAIQYLEKAKSISPDYGKTYLYLGMIYERQNDIPKAIKEYNSYYQIMPFTPMGRKLKARIGILMRNQIASEIKSAIQQEKSLSVTDIPENSIAVVYFSNHTGNDELDPLRKGIADMMTTDLSQVRSLKVLERTRLQLLMDEIGLASQGIIDPESKPRIGKLLGARRLVSGGFSMPQQGSIRLDSISNDIVSEKVDAETYVSGKLDQFFNMEKQLVFGILKNLNIDITQEERDAIQKIPTESFLAFLAYCRGIDYEDRGMYKEASSEFKRALEIDPKFSLANDKLNEIEPLIEVPMTGSINEINQLEQSVTEVEQKETEKETLQGISAIDRLEPIVKNASEGFFPETQTSEEIRNAPQKQNTTIMNITINW